MNQTKLDLMVSLQLPNEIWWQAVHISELKILASTKLSASAAPPDYETFSRPYSHHFEIVFWNALAAKNRQNLRL